MSDSQWLRESGWKNFNAFMLWSGLKMYNVEDVEYGKAILRGCRESEVESDEEVVVAKKEEGKK